MLCLSQIASWRYLTAEPAGGGGEAAERVVVEVELDVGGAGWCYAPGDRHTHTHTQTHTHARTRTRTHARTHKNTHEHARTHAQAHTYTPRHPCRTVISGGGDGAGRSSAPGERRAPVMKAAAATTNISRYYDIGGNGEKRAMQRMVIMKRTERAKRVCMHDNGARVWRRRRGPAGLGPVHPVPAWQRPSGRFLHSEEL